MFVGKLKMRKILFVCYGNICRSPFAERMFNKLAKGEGLGWTSTSAGIYVTLGFPPFEAISAGRRFNVDLSSHTAREVDVKTIEECDLVLCMEEQQRDHLKRRFPGSSDKIFTILEFVGEGGNIHDPYGMPQKYYDLCFRRMREILGKLVSKLKSSPDSAPRKG
jgi:protein-tyrosine-phosphatase